MPQHINRDEIVSKLTIVNKIIRKGYDQVFKNISGANKEYCLSIKDNDYFQIREQLMSELYPLVYKN
jgi:hypothetical protein